MLDIKLVRESPDRVRAAIADKGIGSIDVVDSVMAADERRRNLLTELQQSQALAKVASRDIGQLMKEGRKGEADERIRETQELRDRISTLEDKVRSTEVESVELMLELPNLPHESVPRGATPEDNVVVFEEGDVPDFDFDPLSHWELAERHSLVDFERGAKVTAAGFPFYIGRGARLQRALVNFFLDLAIEEGGYTEMQAPLLVGEASARGTGQLPDKEDLMYEVGRDGLFLIPTAEIPVTNYLRDEILTEDQLPVRFCGHTACFRREAGSYGKEVRGLNRLHQFDKVELVQFVHPDVSYDVLEQMREDAERAVRRLGLPYRRLLMCTGDMGFTQSKKYDLEVWSAGQGRWLEVSSISNFEDFQSRRTGTRFRTGSSRPEFVHTLNGSGLALPRVVAALLENNQRPDGSISMPEAIRSYTGFDEIT